MRNALKNLICSIFLVVLVTSVAACTENDAYRLTVQDPHGYIIEDLQERYKAGETITVKTTIICDASLVAFLDGISLGAETPVQTGDRYTHWEFYFEMPAHDAVLSFELKDGFLPGESAMDREIKAAYVAKHPSGNLTEADVTLRRYGEFDGTHVLLIDVAGSATAQVETLETVDGITFCFAVRESFDVYRAEEFYTLQQAFDLGFLTHDNLYSVWEKHREENYSLYDSGRVTLNAATTTEIVAAYIAAYSTDSHPLTEEDVKLRCFGAFDGVYVFFVDVASVHYMEVICGETVSGVDFIYSNSHSLTVYSEGEFCSISEAFEKELLTHDELLTVQKNYRVGREYLYNEYLPNTTGEYKLTEALQDSYKAGEVVTVKTEVLCDVDMIAYLDGVSLGRQTTVKTGDR